MPHLVVSISGHGFGHVAQTAPILNLLPERTPQLQLTVRSAVPLSHLRSRIRVPFDHLPSEGDIGMVMSSALDVRVEQSRAAYRAFHADCCAISVRIWCSPTWVICRWQGRSVRALPMRRYAL
jgi:hypothetical protein